jgi:hypothetical protein
MAGNIELMVSVIMTVHIRDLQARFVNRGFQGHVVMDLKWMERAI